MDNPVTRQNDPHSWMQHLDPAEQPDSSQLPETRLAQLHALAGGVGRSAADGSEGEANRTGILALFTGPSGSGKTMAAIALAREFGAEVIRVDLAQVVSKYIGETEKNLNAVFAAAERSGALLFLDEADGLFGKRSEVKDSHDRYANIEANALIRQIESHPGRVILGCAEVPAELAHDHPTVDFGGSGNGGDGESRP